MERKTQQPPMLKPHYMEQKAFKKLNKKMQPMESK